MLENDDRMGRLARLFLIYSTLEVGGRLRGNDLAAACGVTVRTIRRDLHTLHEAGAHIAYDFTLRSYKLETPLPCLKVELPALDLLALALAQASIPAGSPHESLARRAFERLLSKLPRELREDMASARAVIGAANQTRRDYGAAPWRELLQAAQQKQTLRMDYHSLSSNKVTTRLIDPYHLVMPNGYLQLVAWCHERRDVRIFALDSIRALHATNRCFDKLPGFSLAQWMEGSLGTLRGEPVEIVIRFDASIARWAKRRKWPFRHTIETVPQADANADGEAVLLRGMVSGLLEIKRELLSWGAKAEVLEPPALRTLMFEEARLMLARYQRDDQPDAVLRKTSKKNGHTRPCGQPVVRAMDAK